MIIIKTTEFCPVKCIDTFKLTFYKGCKEKDVISFLNERGMKRSFKLPVLSNEYQIIN